MQGDFENIRKRVREGIKKEMKKELFKKDLETLARNLETGVFNRAITEASAPDRNIFCNWGNPAFREIYVARARMVYLNREMFLHALDEGKMSAQELSDLNLSDLARYKDLRDKKDKRDKSKLDVRRGYATTLYTCKVCKMNDCSFYELQVRSADEPMTVYVTCNNCGKHWCA